MGLFQLSFTVLIYYHSSCILRFGDRSPCSATLVRILVRVLKNTKLPSKRLRFIRCAFSVKLSTHCYYPPVARRYRVGPLLCFTAAKKMFQLAAFVRLVCNFSQNIVTFLRVLRPRKFFCMNSALIGLGRFYRSKMIS